MNLSTYFANYTLLQLSQFEETFIDRLRDQQMVGLRPEAIQRDHFQITFQLLWKQQKEMQLEYQR